MINKLKSLSSKADVASPGTKRNNSVSIGPFHNTKTLVIKNRLKANSSIRPPVASEVEQEESSVKNMSSHADNSHCADCGSQGTRWVSLSLGVWVCNTCADIHRESLGKIMSDMKSLDIGTFNFWTKENVQYLKMMGNKKANERFEHNIKPGYYKPNSESDRKVRLEYLTAKYVYAEFLRPTSGHIYIRTLNKKKPKWIRVWTSLNLDSIEIFSEDKETKLDEIDLKDLVLNFEAEKWELLPPPGKDVKLNSGIIFQLIWKEEKSYLFNVLSTEEFEDWIPSLRFLIIRRRAVAQRELLEEERKTREGLSSISSLVSVPGSLAGSPSHGPNNSGLVAHNLAQSDGSVSTVDLTDGAGAAAQAGVAAHHSDANDDDDAESREPLVKQKKSLRELLAKRTEEKELERGKLKNRLQVLMETLKTTKDDKVALQSKLEELERISSTQLFEQQSLQHRIAQLDHEPSLLNSNIYKDEAQCTGSTLQFSKEDSVIEGGTVTKLIEMLTYEVYLDAEYVNVFLLTYRSFMVASELLEKLIERFQVTYSPGTEEEEIKKFIEGKQKPIRYRVFNVIKSWLTNHFEDFDGTLIGKLIAFIEEQMEPALMLPGSETLREIIRKKTKQKYKAKKVEVDPEKAPKPLVAADLQTVNFDALDPNEIARQICIIDHALFREVKPREFLMTAWEHENLKQTAAPNILAFNRRLVAVGSWVSTQILRVENLTERVKKLQQMINVAHNLKELHNYQGVQGVLSGLQAATVHRLKKTWDLLDPKSKEKFESIVSLMNSDREYENLRIALPKEAGIPAVPLLAMSTSKLQAIEESYPDKLGPGLINFAKRRKIAGVIRDFQFYQTTPYQLVPIEAIQTFLSRGLQSLDDKQAFNLSLSIEPREKEIQMK
eukprot:TRINITY_DN8022_c0_g1_i1.p1 TRINITY_DN8022_c0_g1~~TRINITY_DN8022_c0_g1_i1.p1  ORF type:complete len:890 (+),score=183.73 TRINITY_DN8022_c0_g1_i1:61-2730(+)